MEKTRGFITVATGKYYCGLAQNLAMSYRLFSDTRYPLVVMTDKDGEKRLKKYFDDVIVLDEPYYTFMDKMTVYQHSPFDRTIFLDADMNIIYDISYLFDDFEKNGSPVSCVGSFRTFEEWGKPIHFGDAAIEAFQLDRYIAFGGGIYYYDRCEETDRFFDFIFNELVPNYKKYQLKEFRGGQMADEPLIGLAMLVRGMRPLDSPKDIMKFHNDMMKTLKWDMDAKKCTFIWWENQLVCPSIVHYGTHNTYTKEYVYYNAILRVRYKKLPKLLQPFFIARDEVHLLFRHMAIPSDRAAFFNWFKAHFTREYFKNKKDQMKSK